MKVSHLWLAVAAVGQLLLTACSNSGTIYNQPVNQTYDMLSQLNLGAEIESRVYRYNVPTGPSGSVANESVSWHLDNDMDVVAHLSDAGEGKTRIVIDVSDSPAMLARVPPEFREIAKDMVRERIMSYLENRPYDDAKFAEPSGAIVKKFGAGERHRREAEAAGEL